MVRHGWSMGDLFDRFGPYLALGMATVPPSLVTWQAIKQQRARSAVRQVQPTSSTTHGSPAEAAH
jgi:hypothetical protein